MRGRKPVIGALLVIGLGYLVYPYATLYRLGVAVRSGDAVALQTLVDWPSVREGIKEDICDRVAEAPAETKQSNQLPPFGSGFVRGIATNVIDARVTPEGLVSAATQPGAKEVPSGASVTVNWAFFGGPSSFVVDLSSEGRSSPIRLQMDLREGGWQVTRVWLPPDLLTAANTRT
jgi:hypothetical protein